MPQNNNQRDVLLEASKSEQTFICTTHCLDVIHIAMKFHQEKTKQTGLTQKRTKGEQPFV